MKNKFFSLLIISSLVLIFTGCVGEKTEINSDEVNSCISNYVLEHEGYNNLVYNYVEEESGNVIVGLIDNNKENREAFFDNIISTCYDSKTVEVIKRLGIIDFKKSDLLTDYDE